MEIYLIVLRASACRNTLPSFPSSPHSLIFFRSIKKDVRLFKSKGGVGEAKACAMSVCLRLYEDEIYMVIKSDIYLLLSHTRAELRWGRACRRRGKRPTDNQLRETDRQLSASSRERNCFPAPLSPHPFWFMDLLLLRTS